MTIAIVKVELVGVEIFTFSSASWTKLSHKQVNVLDNVLVPTIVLWILKKQMEWH